MFTSIRFLLFAIGLFIGMVAFLEIGRRIGHWQRARDPDGSDKGVSAVDGAVFALFGLLLAFTFSGAASRFDHRRALIIQEADAIGSAYLRVDLLPAESQPAVRALFRDYVQSRIARFEKYADAESSHQEYLRGVKLQGEIWKLAVAGVQASASPPLAGQLLPALNDMIDITTTRLVATQTHPPMIIFYMVDGLALVVSLLAGYGMSASKTRQWLHILAFSAAITATIYVVLDIENPRSGLIRIDMADRLLVDVLDSMK